jgi:hypothetical protein
MPRENTADEKYAAARRNDDLGRPSYNVSGSELLVAGLARIQWGWHDRLNSCEFSYSKPGSHQANSELLNVQSGRTGLRISFR